MSAPSKDLPLLLDLAYAAYNRAMPKPDGTRGDFQPMIDPSGSLITFCNEAVQSVLAGFGLQEMVAMTANNMVIHMADARYGWITVKEEVAQAHANNGVLVIAGWFNSSGHGHICVVLPGVLERSNSYGCPVPKCLNIGETVFIGKRVSYAFSSERRPEYFACGVMV